MKTACWSFHRKNTRALQYSTDQLSHSNNTLDSAMVILKLAMKLKDSLAGMEIWKIHSLASKVSWMIQRFRRTFIIDWKAKTWFRCFHCHKWKDLINLMRIWAKNNKKQMKVIRLNIFNRNSNFRMNQAFCSLIQSWMNNQNQNSKVVKKLFWICRKWFKIQLWVNLRPPNLQLLNLALKMSIIQTYITLIFMIIKNLNKVKTSNLLTKQRINKIYGLKF